MAASKPVKRVVVIGAGVGGLATAARLAKAGLSVTLVEKNERGGGRCGSFDQDGFRFDTGPSFYLMPEVFEALFEDLGEKVEDWYKLKKCDPNYVIYYDDGEQVTLSTDMATMKREVEKWEGVGGWARFLAFLDEGRTHYEASLDQVLSRNFPSFLSLLRLEYLIMAIKLHVFDVLHRRASKYFWSERMRRAFTFASMYLGMSPFSAPATYSLLQYTELAQGIWYPVGGFRSLPHSLQQIGERLGARYRLSTPVRRIVLDDECRRTRGVELETGEVLEADAVVCNADLVWAYNNLLPPSDYARRLATKGNLTCSSISFYWGLSRPVPSLRAHQLFLASDYAGSFTRIFDEKVLPHEPSFYVHCASKMDPSAAPDGKESVVVLVPVGHLVDDDEAAGIKVEGGAAVGGQDWPALVAFARSKVLETLTARLPDGFAGEGGFGSLIETERVATPKTWKEDLNLFKGSILGLSHDILQVLAFRPRIRHDSISSLFFVGASTHPGTGVPIVAAGSRLTADEVLVDFGIRPPWPRDASSLRRFRKGEKDMDVLKPPALLRLEEVVTWLVLPAMVVVVAWMGLARVVGMVKA